MAGGSSGTNSVINCKRCNAKVVSGIKCRDCNNYFHPSCARYVSSIEIIDDNTVICCKTECDNPEDVELCDALSEIVDSNNKIDFRVVKYILNQKNAIIVELREKIRIMSHNAELLKQCSISSKSHQEITNVTCEHKDISSVNSDNDLPLKSIKNLNGHVSNTNNDNSVVGNAGRSSDSVDDNEGSNNIDRNAELWSRVVSRNRKE